MSLNETDLAVFRLGFKAPGTSIPKDYRQWVRIIIATILKSQITKKSFKLPGEGATGLSDSGFFFRFFRNSNLPNFVSGFVAKERRKFVPDEMYTEFKETLAALIVVIDSRGCSFSGSEYFSLPNMV